MGALPTGCVILHSMLRLISGSPGGIQTTTIASPEYHVTLPKNFSIGRVVDHVINVRNAVCSSTDLKLKIGYRRFDAGASNVRSSIGGQYRAKKAGIRDRLSNS